MITVFPSTKTIYQWKLGNLGRLFSLKKTFLYSVEMATTGEKRTVLIVTAGLSRSGKSTAMNNIFGADFRSVYSASSVTRAVEPCRIEGHADELIVVDTPGLGATDIKFAKVKEELLDAIGGLNFVLVYCYSVSPSNPQSLADVYVVKNLQRVLGKDVWKKCDVLFTFSDFLREQECCAEKDRENYKKFLRDHAKRLSDMLHKVCGSHVPDVKVVFDVDTEQEDVTEIVAIPVGRQLKRGREVHFLVPGTKAANWQELALCEIMRKADPIDRGVYLSFTRIRTPLKSTIVGGAIGGAVGGIGGAVVGLAAFGVGAIPGAMIGLGVGAAAGVVAGGAVGGVGILTMKEVKDHVRSVRIKKLRKARQIKRNSAPPDLELSQSCYKLRSTSLSVYNKSSASESSASHSKRTYSAVFDSTTPNLSNPNPLYEESSFDRLSQSYSLSTQWVSAEQPEPYQDPEEPEPYQDPENPEP